MSQSPEGSAGDFHARNPPAHSHRRNPCLNPPKGPPAISTETKIRLFERKLGMSQSPEGSAGDFHPAPWATGPPPYVERYVSIPRRVRRRFPLNLSCFMGTSLCTSQSPEGSAGDFHFPHELGVADVELVSIPRRVRRRFPRVFFSGQNFHFRSQSPEGSAGDFHMLRKSTLIAAVFAMSQSPEGSAGDFHLP